jgi:hypothetical protein
MNNGRRHATMLRYAILLVVWGPLLAADYMIYDFEHTEAAYHLLKRQTQNFTEVVRRFVPKF